jgi:starch-binding outer membrane protein, SusD/RagB family
MNKIILFLKWSLPACLIFIVIPSCKKWVDPGVPDQLLAGSKVFANDSIAQASLIGIYQEIMNNFGMLNGNITKWAGIYSDELDRTTRLDADIPFQTNSLTKQDNKILEIWTTAYHYIYLINDLMKGLEVSKNSLSEKRNKLYGEALFLRSLVYFYLVNLFGDVPLATGTDYISNSKLPRASASQIYKQMISDLQEAQKRLDDQYTITTEYPTERIRVNRLAATALLARVLLYNHEWTAAEAAATEVIQSALYQLEQDLQQTFQISSKEAILQFMAVSNGFNTGEGALFVPISSNGKPAYKITDSLVKNFETADKRWAWIRKVQIGGIFYYSPFKYKVGLIGPPYKEYYMVLRLSEQFLIRCEARTEQDKLHEATADLNIIRQKAGLSMLATFRSKTELMDSLQVERSRELFSEWGHRWFDLKRWPSSIPLYSTKADEVMSRCKSTTWDFTDKLWPIPSEEIDRDPALIQNPGY